MANSSGLRGTRVSFSAKSPRDPRGMPWSHIRSPARCVTPSITSQLQLTVAKPGAARRPMDVSDSMATRGGIRAGAKRPQITQLSPVYHSMRIRAVRRWRRLAKRQLFSKSCHRDLSTALPDRSHTAHASWRLTQNQHRPLLQKVGPQQGRPSRAPDSAARPAEPSVLDLAPDEKRPVTRLRWSAAVP
jgi:hypothetical protein